MSFVVMLSGSHDDVEKENTRIRKEVHLPRQQREVLKLRCLEIDPVDQL